MGQSELQEAMGFSPESSLQLKHEDSRSSLLCLVTGWRSIFGDMKTCRMFSGVFMSSFKQ